MRQLTEIKLKYFTPLKVVDESTELHTFVLSQQVRKQLKNIAAQCYVKGGPSVFMARSMYWAATDDVYWGFQDDCLVETGYYKSETSENESIERLNDEFYFYLYPNPKDANQDIVYIQNSEKGTLRLYNNIGQLVHSATLMPLFNEIQLSHLSAGVYTYKVVFDSGKVQANKLVIR